MAFPSTITVNNAAAAAKDFVLNLLSGTTSDRMESTSTLVNPVRLGIRHNYVVSKNGNDAYDRHVVTFSKAVTDADDKVHTGTVSISLTVPRVSDISRADLNDLLAYARNFTGVTGNVDSLLRNES